MNARVFTITLNPKTGQWESSVEIPQDIRTFAWTTGDGVITEDMIKTSPMFRIFLQNKGSEENIITALDVVRNHVKKLGYEMETSVEHYVIDIIFKRIK